MTLIKRFIEKTSEYSIVDSLFLILLFYLPFLNRFHKPLDKMAKKAYSSLEATSFFVDRVFDFYLTDLIMIGIMGYIAIFLRPNLKELFWDKEKKWMASFLILSGISFVFSDPQAWALYRWLQIVLIIMAYFMISQALNLQKIVFIILGIITSTALAESVIVIIQYFSQDILGLKHLGERTEFLAKFTMPDKSLWSLNSLFKAYSTVICRAQGTFPHPNILGGFLGFSLFFYLFLIFKKPVSKNASFTRSCYLYPIFCSFSHFFTGIHFCLLPGITFIHWPALLEKEDTY